MYIVTRRSYILLQVAALTCILINTIPIHFMLLMRVNHYTGNPDVSLPTENITFPEYSMSGDIRCFDVLINDDDLLEGEETVEMSLASDDVTVGSDLYLIICDSSDLDGMCIRITICS